MIPIVDQEYIYTLESHWINEYNIPSILLMEHAALEMFHLIIKRQFKSIHIYCGLGNNGGDGLALARLLINADISVNVFLVNGQKPKTVEALNYYNILNQLACNIEVIESKSFIERHKEMSLQPDLIIDGIFGIGVNRNIEGVTYDVIEYMNQLTAEKWSIDIPSGLNANTGEVMGIAVNADQTITFILPKKGCFINQGTYYTGQLIYSNITFKKALDQFNNKNTPYIYWMNESLEEIIAMYLQKRPLNAHKYTFGKTVVFAGSKNMPGAALLAANAAYQVGAGVVLLVSDESTLSSLRGKTEELMYMNFETLVSQPIHWKSLMNATSILFGPGLVENQGNLEMLKRILSSYTGRCIVDATGIKLLKTLKEHVIQKKCHLTITPHLGEFAQLVQADKEAILINPIPYLQKYSKEWSMTIILKGPLTWISTSDGIIRCMYYPNPGLATAGTGDVLAGVIAGLSGYITETESIGILGNAIHSLSGRLAVSAYGEYSLKASQLIENFGKILK